MMGLGGRRGCPRLWRAVQSSWSRARISLAEEAHGVTRSPRRQQRSGATHQQWRRQGHVGHRDRLGGCEQAPARRGPPQEHIRPGLNAPHGQPAPSDHGHAPGRPDVSRSSRSSSRSSASAGLAGVPVRDALAGAAATTAASGTAGEAGAAGAAGAPTDATGDAALARPDSPSWNRRRTKTLVCESSFLPLSACRRRTAQCPDGTRAGRAKVNRHLPLKRRRPADGGLWVCDQTCCCVHASSRSACSLRFR